MEIKKRYVLILLLFGIFFSCKDNEEGKNQKLQAETINVSKWNSEAIKHAYEFCELNKNEYKKGPIIADKEGRELTFKTHLEEILEKRTILIDTLKKMNFSIDNCFTIIESYRNSRTDWNPVSKDAYYRLFSNEERTIYVFSIGDKENQFKIERKEWENPKEFYLDSNKNCINELGEGHPIGQVDIKSKICMNEEGAQYNIEYIYFGE